MQLQTLAEAADELNVSTRTILRKLKKGHLQGYKIIGLNGPEWRIHSIDIQDTVTGDAHCINTDTSIGMGLAGELMSKIESLAYRNGYLEAQLADKTEQIKLLIDSQHKNWWQEFRSWIAVK